MPTKKKALWRSVETKPIVGLCLELSQETHDVVPTTIRRLYDVADVVQTSYRRWNDVVCLLGSSLVPRKDKLNAKAKEGNVFPKEKYEESNFDLISNFNINLHCHTNARGQHLNNYGDRQLTKNILNYIEKDNIYRNMQWILLYLYYWKN